MCPGHVGHIELPDRVYHVNFMDQLLRLLRAQCAYCNHLKMHPMEINRFICKLRLIRYGLLEAAGELDNIQPKSRNTGTGSSESDMASEDEESNNLVQERNNFVKRAIKSAGGVRRATIAALDKVESVSAERRVVVKEFLGAITKTRTCGSCKGY